MMIKRKSKKSAASLKQVTIADLAKVHGGGSVQCKHVTEEYGSDEGAGGVCIGFKAYEEEPATCG